MPVRGSQLCPTPHDRWLLTRTLRRIGSDLGRPTDPSWGSFYQTNNVFEGPIDYDEDETSIGCTDTYNRSLPGAGIWCEGADLD
jgi:hypothetical protein